jgi:[ribosomal protein S5]-alanine N-acetyltransferase
LTTPSFPALETPRLLLREIRHSDAPALFAVHGDPESMKWFGNDALPDEAAAIKLIDTFSSWRVLPNPGIRWGIQPKGQDTLVGTCGLFAWNRAWRKCTLGYELVAASRRNGYMHEALQTCLTWGFDNMDLNRIEANVHPDNAASIRSIERLGFRQEGLLRELGYWRRQFHDMYQYSLLRRDWPLGNA